ncbi:hypothetical protein P3T36_006697 [Kitasatospora sp. MAP12-15]|uniref:hypothetical protein n=1 Tax=unclassified Kitasatospora TaxID=2633591 RepID=UPI0024772D29|nr:hypothetical protein [Kitasatospora sp. MAP12-44]MDH6115287.1 hypothetical protein [Kitasatospora sp. MAP12-44]
MKRFVGLGVAVLLAGVGTLASAPSASATDTISINAAVIDAKYPSKVHVDVAYTCDTPAGERSLNVSVEQPDPQDPSTIAFGSTRVSEDLIICDGTEQTTSVIVQSKTTNWVPDAPAVMVTTVSDIGADPSANADAKKFAIHIDQPAAATS